MTKTNNLKDFFASLKNILTFKGVINEEEGSEIVPTQIADLISDINDEDFGTFIETLICKSSTGFQGVRYLYISGVSPKTESYRDLLSLYKVILSEEITALGSGCFQGCTSLNEVKATPSLKTINGLCFYLCRNLKTLIGFDNVERADTLAFDGTAFITNHDNGPIYIGKVLYLYKGGTLDEVEIEHDLTQITNSAFSNKTLKKIIITNTSKTNILNVSTEAFLKCSNLEDIYIDSKVKLSLNCFKNCEKINTVYISHLEEISYAFPDSDNITRFYLLNDAESVPVSDRLIGLTKYKEKATFYVKKEAIEAWEKVLVGYDIQPYENE